MTFVSDSTVVTQFECVCSLWPDKVALVFGDETLTYKTLNSYVNGLALVLSSNYNLCPGDTVIVHLDPSIESIVAMLAILKTGAIYIPLETDHPLSRLQSIIYEVSPTCIIDSNLSIISSALKNKVLVLNSYLELPFVEDNVNSDIKANDPAYIIFTSGTTGKPKGVVISHHNFYRLFKITEKYFNFDSNDVIPLLHSLAFDFSLWEIGSALLYGGELVIVSKEDRKNTELILNLLSNKSITVLNQTPLSFSTLLDSGLCHNETPTKHLRTIVFGGDRLAPHIIHKWHTLMPEHPCLLVNMYGITEITVHGTYYLIDKSYGRQNRVIIGKMLEDLGFYIIDQHNNICPDGVPGELCIYGQGVSSRGYYNNSELTSQKFKHYNHTNTYYSGDLVRLLPSGDLEYIGRIDNQVKIRGYRVELNEIKIALLELTEISDCAVIKTQDHDDDEYLIGYLIFDSIISDQSSFISLESKIITHLKIRLPDYMIPRLFISIKNFPLTVNGKIDFIALKAINHNPTSLTQQNNDIQNRLINIFSACLKKSGIKPNDDFFALGGYSLLVMRLLTEINSQFSVEIGFKDVINNPTVEQLSDLLNDRMTDHAQTSLKIKKCPPSGNKLYTPSSCQSRIYYMQQLIERESPFNTTMTIEIKGPFSISIFKKSITFLMDRHAIFRTQFVLNDGDLNLKIIDNFSVKSPIHHVRVTDDDTNYESTLKDFFEQEFQLETDLLFRIMIIEINPNSFILGLCFHHLLIDQHSLKLVFDEISNLYNTDCKSSEVEILQYNYFDYIYSEIDWLNSPEADKSRNFWKKYLVSDGEETLTFNSSHLLSPDAIKPKVYSVILNQSITKAIQEHCLSIKKTAFTVLISYFHVAMIALYNKRALNIVTPIANRRQAETEKIIGPMINLLPIKMNTSKSNKMIDHINNCHLMLSDIYDHQDFPYNLIVTQCQRILNSVSGGDYQIYFSFDNNPTSLPKFSECDVKDITTYRTTSQFSLSLSITTDASNQFQLHFEYSPAAIKAPDVLNLAQIYVKLLTDINTNILTSIDELTAFSIDRSRACNQGKLSTLIDYIYDMSQQNPNQIAIRTSENSLTYSQLYSQSRAFAQYLVESSIGINDIIGVYAERECQLLVILIGILTSGAAYCPLDLNTSTERLNFIIRDANPKAIIYSTSELSTSFNYTGQLINFNTLPLENDNTLPPHSLCLATHAPAYVIYTSGSTGSPKGVVVSYFSLLSCLHGMKKALSIPDEISFLAATNICFDIAATELFMPLISKGTVLLSPFGSMDDIHELVEFIDLHKPKYIQATPSLYKLIFDAGWNGSLESVLLCGGEVLNQELAQRLSDNSRELWHMYGPTETTIWATCHRFSGQLYLGAPLPEYDVFVLNKQFSVCNEGEIGELYISGAGVAIGYLNRPDLTNNAFIKLSTYNNQLMYRTGDLCRVNSRGEIEFIGRTDRQIKLRGYRIELDEVECLIREVSGIKDAAVVYNDSSSIIIAYIVLDKTLSSNNSNHFIQDSILAKLPIYMRPSKIIIKDCLPLSSSHKIDYSQLKHSSENIDSRELDQSQDTIERRLLEFVSSLINNPALTLDDNFFTNGGHSLLALKLINQYHSKYGKTITLREFLKNPTTRYLVDNIAAAPKPPEYDLTPTQMHFWLLELRYASTPSVSLLWEINGAINIDAIRRAIKFIANKYSILRVAIYANSDGVPHQVVCPKNSIALHSDRIAGGGISQISKIAQNHQFILSKGNLCYFYLNSETDHQHYFLMSFHHIIIDGWSIDLLIRELNHVYEIFNQNTQPSTTEDDQYLNWTKVYNSVISKKSRSNQLQYSKDYLINYSAKKLFLADCNNSVKTDMKSAIHSRTIRKSMLDESFISLQKIPLATEFSIFLSIFQLIIHDYTNSDCILITTPISGRRSSEQAEILGPFVKLIPLISCLNLDITMEDHVSATIESVLSCYENSELSYEEVLDCIKWEVVPDNDIHLNQLMFVYQPENRTVLKLENCEIHEHIIHSEFSKSLLTLWVREREDYIQFDFEYVKSCVTPSDVKAIADKYLDFITQKNISTQSAAREWLNRNDYGAKTPLIIRGPKVSLNNHSITELIDLQFMLSKNKIALVFSDKDFTYRQLSLRCKGLGKYLFDKQIFAGDIIGVCLERSIESVISILTIFKLGAVYFPINPNTNKTQLNLILSDAKPKIIITNDIFLNLFHSIPIKLCIPDWQEDDEFEFVSKLADDDSAYLIYSSGTTGSPKGILGTHYGLLNRIAWMQSCFDLKPEDRVAHKTPLNFDVSLWEIVWPLAFGAQLHIAPNNIEADPRLLTNFIEKNHINIIHFVPSMLDVFLDTCDNTNCTSLRLVIVSGEAISKNTINHFYRLSSAELHNLYGPTEASIDVTHWHCEKNTHIVKIGLPIWNTDILILNSKNELVGANEIGEIHISGRCLAKGYYNNTELTAQYFTTKLKGSHGIERVYSTGDLGRYFTDGSIEFCGRVDSQVKQHGHRLILNDIEKLVETLDTVNQVKILQINHNSQDYLVAFISTNNNNFDTVRKQIRELISISLPAAAIPSYYIHLDLLPVTQNGKCDFNKLRSEFQSIMIKKTQTLSSLLNEEKIRSRLPNTDKEISFIERSVKECWRKYLEHSNIDLDMNFFECGGKSILMIKIKMDLENIFDIKMDLIDILNYPTIRLLSKRIIVLLNNQNSNFSEINFATEHSTVNHDNLTIEKSIQENDIAIIGMDCRAPGAQNIDELWSNLCNGLDTIHFFSDEDLLNAGISQEIITARNYVKAKGTINNIDSFDYHFFKISPQDAETLDPQQRVFLEMCWSALFDAGYTQHSHLKVSVYASANSIPLYLIHHLLNNKELINRHGLQQLTLNNQCDSLATRVAYKLGLKGSAITIQTACSSSLVAVHTAIQSLRRHESDIAIAGGINITLPQISGYRYEEGMIASPDGHCRAFDSSGKGIVPADGAGVVILRRLNDAIEAKDHIYAVIKGSGISNDGNLKAGYTAPSSEGQAAAVRSALTDAGVFPHQISYIEAHGTGTLLGDSIEIEALKSVFSDDKNEATCLIGSIKSNIGHTNTAAGVIGLIKTALMLCHKTLVPSLHVKTPIESLKSHQKRFEISTITKEWNQSEPLYAGVSSFGMGGTNVHAILTEPKRFSPNHSRDHQCYMIVLNAHSYTSLIRQQENLLAWLKKNPSIDIGCLAYTYQKKKFNAGYSSYFSVYKVSELIELLKSAQDFSYSIKQNKYYFSIDDSHDIYDIQPIPDDKKIQLRVPSYIFDYQYCWVESDKCSNPSLRFNTQRAPIDCWTYVQKWQETPLPKRTAPVEGRKYLLLHKNSEDAQSIIDNFNIKDEYICVCAGNSFKIITTHHITLQPGHEEDYIQLLHHLKAINWYPDVIVHAFGQESSISIDEYSDSHFHASQKNGFYSVLYLTRQFCKIYANKAVKFIAISSGSADIHTSASLNIANAPLKPSTTIIRQEYAGVKIKEIDIEYEIPTLQSTTSNLVLSEIFSDNYDDHQVVYRSRKRYIVSYQSINVAMHYNQNWRENGTYIIVGGFGHMGAVILEEIRKTINRGNIIVISRTAEQNCLNNWTKNNFTHKLGLTLSFMKADVGNYESFHQAYSDIKHRFGEIDGIIYAAGSPGSDKNQYCANITRDLVESHFITKVTGIINLYRIIQNEPPRFSIIMTSLAAQLGGQGLIGYAAANYTCDMIVKSINAKFNKTIFYSINWDNWTFAEHNERTINPPEGMKILNSVLLLCEDVIQVSIYPIHQRIFEINHLFISNKNTILHENNSAPDIKYEYYENITQNIWQEYLGKGSHIAGNNFYELGGDSIISINIAHAISQKLSLPVMPYDIMENPSYEKFLGKIKMLLDENAKKIIDPSLRNANQKSNPYEIIPLSIPQRRVWITEQRFLNSPIHNMPYTFWINGELCINSLSKSLMKIIERYDTLRLSIEVVDDEPKQIYHNSVSFDLKYLTPSFINAEDKDHYLKTFLEKELDTPFDLTSPPLLRASVIKMAERQYVFILFIHHIVTDGYSMQIFLKDLSFLYRKYVNNENIEMPKVDMQYSDFTLWQHKKFDTEQKKNSIEFWKEYLSDCPTITELPYDKKAKSEVRYRGGYFTLQSEKNTLPNLRKLSRESETTLFITNFALYFLFLHHYTGQKTIVVGTPTSQRHLEKTRNLFGFIVNTLPVKYTFSNNIPLKDYIIDFKNIIMECFRNQDVYLDEIVQSLKISVVAEHQPLFQTAFMFQENSELALNLYGLDCIGLEDEHIAQQRMSRTDLYCITEVIEDILHFRIEYSIDLFNECTIQAFLGFMRSFYADIANESTSNILDYNFSRSLKEISLLNSSISSDIDQADTWIEAFTESAKANNIKIAIQDSNDQITYEKLDQMSECLARSLITYQLSNQIVAILMQNSINYYITLLGIQKSGSAFFTIDPDLPLDRIKSLISQSRPSFLIYDSSLTHIASTLDITSGTYSSLINFQANSNNNFQLSTKPENDAYVIHTSGSTGNPKLIPITQHSLACIANELRKIFTDSSLSRVLQFSNRSFDAFISEWATCWLSGGVLCLIDDLKKKDPDTLVEAINSYSITMATFPPALLAYLKCDSISSIETIVSAGENCRQSIINEFAPRIRLLNGYGPTEATIC